MPPNLKNLAVATGLKKFSFHSSPKESEVAQSCPTLRDPLDCSPPGSSVHGIFKARVLEWVAIAFSSPKERQCQIMLKLPHNCTHLTCGKASAGNAGDPGSIPGLGRSPGEGNGNPFNFCLGNTMDRRAWQATGHRVAKSQIKLSDLDTHNSFNKIS